VTWPTAQLNRLYTSARSMGKKQELEHTMQLESYNIVADSETQGHESHDWSVAINS